MTNLSKTLQKIIAIVIFTFLVWILVSLIEVQIFNLDSGHDYFDFNFFKLIFQKVK